jgi:hypothetical protein
VRGYELPVAGRKSVEKKRALEESIKHMEKFLSGSGTYVVSDGGYKRIEFDQTH